MGMGRNVPGTLSFVPGTVWRRIFLCPVALGQGDGRVARGDQDFNGVFAAVVVEGQAIAFERDAVEIARAGVAAPLAPAALSVLRTRM